MCGDALRDGVEHEAFELDAMLPGVSFDLAEKRQRYLHVQLMKTGFARHFFVFRMNGLRCVARNLVD